MKSISRRSLFAAVTLALPSLAQAHPGHDGDHDFVWDFQHLVSHPLATLLCVAAVGAAIWGVRSLITSRRTNPKARTSRH
jgi:hydrogenase/urease accessory protein HupE